MPDAPAHRPQVFELRVVLTAADQAEAVEFYRDLLGLSQLESFSGEHGEGVVLDAGQATLEILDDTHASYVDSVEVGRRTAGPLRLAFRVTDTRSVTERLTGGGARLLAAPTETPWRSLNSRLEAPGGLQLTIFSEAPAGELS